MFKNVMAYALLATFASCGNSNAVDTVGLVSQSAITQNKLDFSGVYDLIETSTIYNDCGSSIQIKTECKGFKIYNNHTTDTDDYCDIEYPKRNPTFPDRNPPPPDRNPPPPDRTPPPPDRNPPVRKPRALNTNKYKTISVTFNGNTVTATDNNMVKTVKLENGYLYKIKYNKYSAQRCVYQKR